MLHFLLKLMLEDSLLKRLYVYLGLLYAASLACLSVDTTGSSRDSNSNSSLLVMFFLYLLD